MGMHTTGLLYHPRTRPDSITNNSTIFEHSILPSPSFHLAEMWTHLFLAVAASLNLASAWHLTPEHQDGFYGITQDEEVHLVMEWNDTIAATYKPKNTNSFRTKRKQYLPAGSLECG